MSSKVSFEGIGEVTATFYAADGVKSGDMVKLTGDSMVAGCAAGERFCGVCVSAGDGYAAVQVGGMMEAVCDDSTVSAGYVTLTADGAGGVKKAGSGDSGDEYLVIRAGDGTVTLKM